MIRKLNYIKIIFCWIILLLSMDIYAFESIKNIPTRNIYFTGRTSYLNNIQKILSQHRVIYLTGYGGIGKSQLAKEYSYVNEPKYDLIWWFDLKSDLRLQYENLLTHLSNSKRFKKFLHINVNNIAPSVIVDFTNSLLSESDCNWLLIFDNVSDSKDVKIPQAKKSGQHAIVTTREKQFFGKNVLTLKPFKNHESELFLSKIHPKEKKEKVNKLSKILFNYPLALAQISEEILMYGNGIESYLKKHENIKPKSIPMHSELIQGYENNYGKVLNITLQDIEQKDREAAKFLYILALLNIDATKEFLKDLLGDTIEEKLIILEKYGVVQTVAYGESRVFNIHDIIIEGAINRLNNKNKKYKEKIVHTLVKYFNTLYSKKSFQHLNKLDANNIHIIALYAFIDIALQNDVINDGVVNAVITALKLNNMLFNRHSDYSFYRKLGYKIYNKNLDNIDPIKKALLYLNLMFSDLIFLTGKNISKFENKVLPLLKLIGRHKDFGDMFTIYTLMFQFYLLSGELKEAEKYAGRAKKNISYADSFSLLQYWYTNTLLNYEIRNANIGMKALDKYMELNDQLSSGELGKLFLRNLKIKFRLLVDQKKEAKEELKKVMKDATIYYNNAFSDILGEVEFTKALIYFDDGQYSLAKNQCYRALQILKKVLGGDMIDFTQANIHLLLGKIHEKNGNNNLAIKEYNKALTYYNNKIPHGKIIGFYEYGELLANLCFVYYKLKNFAKSKFYYQQLVLAFDLEHDIIGDLIKKLPNKYMYQIGGKIEKITAK